MLTVLDGKGGGGKSTLMMCWCKTILKDHDVLYLDKDNNLSVAQYGLGRFYTTMPPNFYYWGDWLKDDAGTERPVVSIENPFVVQMLAEMHNPVVVIDTLNRFSACDENDNREMGEFVSQCKRLSNRYGASVIILHHENKSGGVRGASAISDNSDNVLSLVSQKDEGGNITSVVVSVLKSKVKLKTQTYNMSDTGLTQTIVSTDERLYDIILQHSPAGISQNNLEKLASGFATRNKVRTFVGEYLVAKKLKRGKKDLLSVCDEEEVPMKKDLKEKK